MEHMEHVVGVRFRPAGRAYYFDPAGFALKTGAWVVVPTAKGPEAARVVIAPKQVEAAELGPEPLKTILRVATDDDLRQMLAFKKKEKQALIECADRIGHHSLPMKLAEAE